ncbi:hypothetical protein Pint_11188 [Pistacia integerrima]|uniref:Uncharacterized protein n=1 Tax=Pistacia integerrima TaxID=434235 RepID=A0ACC0XJC7_9ROSI|nr:hypothetical protein Pint_11188 [Pistacia integerrima]
MFSSFVGSQVLLTSCKVMAPFTPFFTEVLYQNMRKVCKESEDSINFCRVPEEEGKRDEQIEKSVSRMMTIIDLALYTPTSLVVSMELQGDDSGSS